MPQRKPFTPFEQGVIYGLHKHANWPLQQIATKLNTTKGAISKLICRVEREPRTPPLRGRPPVLTTQGFESIKSANWRALTFVSGRFDELFKRKATHEDLLNGNLSLLNDIKQSGCSGLKSM
ncbi:hypothetical protein M433DRAFT_9570 [Acidomyces richmondensis BFW]|nr:hypothetical protein M433DRAFT_9570 [Acidomyces richmondensis BFW]